jgi:hypothetical protein
MSESNNRDSILDAAIESYPPAPLPSGFVNRVMAQVRQQPQAIVPPRFRLQFLDVALPAFLALFTFLVVVVGMWLTGQLDAAGLPGTQLNLTLAGQIPAWFGISAVAVLGEVMVAIMVGVTLWLDQPFLPVDQS